ncbi:MAG: YceI family protein [Chloroflexi bacterium]|nr:YceI family protein [Chloroflexota bacterium]
MSNTSRSGVPYYLVLILLLIALAGGAAAGILGYIWITGGSGEPSLTVEDALATLEASEDGMAEAVGTAMVDVANTVIAEAVALAVAEAVDVSVSAAVDSSVAAAMEALAPASEPVEFKIIAAESRASFTLEEDLRGVRTTVIGSTSEVGGSIMVDMANPGASSIGAIVINARTLETDNSFRNRALRSQILKSAQDEFEFIIFEPRELRNWSADTVSVGETVNFDVAGDLTVAGVTQPVSFAVTVALDSETQISGGATVNLLHGDFGLVIPDVRSVANVTDDVTLSLDFVARAG